MRYDFMILDVFTDKPFGGNKLAVLTDARGITTAAMQTITREFDFPETVFVLPASEPANSRRIRIFTPGTELPFAGHPTVGTACALVMSGICPAGDVILEEGVGPVPVVATNVGGAHSARFRLTSAPETSEMVPPAADVAAALSLQPQDIGTIFCAGMGPRFTFVQVGSRETVDRSQLDHQQWRRLIPDTWGAQLYLFAGDLNDGSEIYVRMYAPAFGIPEDAATGSAAAAIVGSAATAAGVRNGPFRLNIVQGVAMGRPSFLSASARMDSGAISAIEVGGSCVLVAEGTIEIPDAMLERVRG